MYLHNNEKQDKEIYIKQLNKFHHDRIKCKCCGNDIYYDNTYISKNGKIYGTSFLTTKNILGEKYGLKVCKDCLLIKYPQIKNIKRAFNVLSELTQWAFDIPGKVFLESRKNYAMTKDKMIQKYGEENGLERWKKYCDRQAETNTFEYKSKKYGITKEDFEKYNKSRSCTLENFIKRYGEEKGRELWNKYVERQRETKSLEYMISTKDTNEVLRILNDRAKGFQMHAELSYSKISQKLFRDIDEYLIKNYGERFHTYFFEKNFEYQIHTDNFKTYMLDYYIEELKLCVEFYGNFWHANRETYKADDYIPIVNKTAGQIWEYDEIRIKTLKDKFDIKTIVIWEKDYKNPEFNLEKFIDNNIKPYII